MDKSTAFHLAAALLAGCVTSSQGAPMVIDEPLEWDGGPVLVFNATHRFRTYVVRNAEHDVDLTRTFTLPAGSSCRIDTGLYLDPARNTGQAAQFHVSDGDAGSVPGDVVEDVSEGRVGVFNAAFVRTPSWWFCKDCAGSGIQELLSCSAMAMPRCAGFRWASWQVALLAREHQTDRYACSFDPRADPCVLEFTADRLYAPLPDWGMGETRFASVYALRFKTQRAKALVMVQGNTGGSGFDMRRIDSMRSADAFAAPWCSSY